VTNDTFAGINNLLPKRWPEVLVVLVLTRRIKEGITLTIRPSTVEQTVEIIVLEIKSGQTIRLGIKAPQEIIADRTEVHEEKLRHGAIR
jgi:carbon storage regulator CsrA